MRSRKLKEKLHDPSEGTMNKKTVVGMAREFKVVRVFVSIQECYPGLGVAFR